MDETGDPAELERKIAQADRISSRVTDQTIYERLKAWVEELRQRLGQRLAARRNSEEIRARAHELWEQNGRPAGRDLEFGFKPILRSASAAGNDLPARLSGQDQSMDFPLCLLLILAV
jgi:Protein of unknown function (DUF2934)